jgi:hypothetical protein
MFLFCSVGGNGSLGRHREAQFFARIVIRLRDQARQGTHAADVGGALGHGNGAARVEHVEAVRGLHDLLVGRQRELQRDQALRFRFVVGKLGEQQIGVGMLEVVGRLLHFVLVVDVAVGQAFRFPIFFPLGPDQVVHVFHALQIHGQAFDAVGDFAQHRLAVQAAHLLEVGELRHFHAVQPDFPAQAPGAQGRAFPVVFDKAHVIFLQVQAQRLQRAQVQVEDVFRRWFQHHLILIIVLQAVRVFAVAAILGTARRLHVGRAPWLRSDRAQEGARVEGAGADFHVVGLEQGAALLVPVGLQGQDNLLECEHQQ